MTQKSVYTEQFKIHLKRLGYSSSSQQMLPVCVREFLDQNEDKELREITSSDILNHYEYLTERPNKRRIGGLSSRMISHHIYAIRLFLNYQEQTGNITDNPISGLYFPKPESKQREILTVEEIKQIYEVAETHREKAIIGMFYGCGLRRSEGVALNVKDISFRGSLMYVRDGKGGKRRVIPINEKVLNDFKNYLYTESFVNNNEDAFICNSAGNRTRGDSYNKILKSLILKSKIDKEISLHSLRHSIATHLLENGLSMEYVRDFLGHKSLEATQIYTRISKKRLSEL